MATQLISSDDWIELVLKKLNIDPSRVGRVVIDANVAQPLLFYITYLGGEELLEVRPPEANEVQIKMVK